MAASSPMATAPLTLETATRYQLNQLRYERDPVGWVDAFVRFPPGEGLAPYQEEILRGLVEHSRITVRAPHRAGKSGLSALIILWFATTRNGMDWKVVTTASHWRQLTKYLWPEVHKWSRQIDWAKLGMPRPREGRELQVMSLKLGTGEAFAVASDQPWGIEGAHADNLQCLFDEAKAIPGATWDAAEGAFSGAGRDTGREALALAVSTPGVGPSRFREIHERRPGYEDWWVRRVTLDEAIEGPHLPGLGRAVSPACASRACRWWPSTPARHPRPATAPGSCTSSTCGLRPGGSCERPWIRTRATAWRSRPSTASSVSSPPRSGASPPTAA